MKERQLPFAKISEPSFVDGCVAQGPGVGEVPLLEAFVGIGAKTGEVGAARLELGKGIKLLVAGKVIVGVELLPFVDTMVQAPGKLVGVVVAITSCLEKCQADRIIRTVTVRLATTLE